LKHCKGQKDWTTAEECSRRSSGDENGHKKRFVTAASRKKLSVRLKAYWAAKKKAAK